MKKEPGGFNTLKYYMDLQGTKLDLALETIQNIATLAAEQSMLDRDSVLVEDLIPILNDFVKRMEDICSEPAL